MLKAAWSGNLIEAGLDEAGRGCLAGPVVAAFVILPKDFYHLYLNDSKKISFKQREQLRTEIQREAIDYGVAEVCNQEIDRINILNASFAAMHKALDTSTCRPELLLIDGNRFTAYPGIPHHCIVKGDSIYFSIAAASILAKTYRDDLMEHLNAIHPEYEWQNNKGYPTMKHKRAIENFGLTTYHRLTFKSTINNHLENLATH